MFALKCSAAFTNKRATDKIWLLFDQFTAHRISTTHNNVAEEEFQIQLITNAVAYGLYTCERRWNHPLKEKEQGRRTSSRLKGKKKITRTHQ